MQIELEEADTKGRYFVVGANGGTAEMAFSKIGDTSIIIDYRDVPEIMRGQGYGEALVARALEDMREARKTILPLCAFAAAQFRRNSKYADILNR